MGKKVRFWTGAWMQTMRIMSCSIKREKAFFNDDENFDLKYGAWVTGNSRSELTGARIDREVFRGV
jgi:hypothetical protein